MSCAEVRVYDTIPPRVGLMFCGTRVDLTINDQLSFPVNYDYFLVNWGDGQTDTVQADQPRSQHVFASTNAGRIRVQSIHQFGNCGGTTQQTFTPNQPPILHSFGRGQPTANGQETAQINIQNAGGVPLTIQQRVGSGVFSTGLPVPAGAAPTLTVVVDTGQTTCFRIVPGGSCPTIRPRRRCATSPPCPSRRMGRCFTCPTRSVPTTMASTMPSIPLVFRQLATTDSLFSTVGEGSYFTRPIPARCGTERRMAGQPPPGFMLTASR